MFTIPYILQVTGERGERVYSTDIPMKLPQFQDNYFLYYNIIKMICLNMQIWVDLK